MTATLPIASPPPLPRWWVTVNSQTEGPHSQAYIAACLSAGQIPASALLCLEGDQRWQPVSSWPQFAGYLGSAPVQATLADPVPPPIPADGSAEQPLIQVTTRRTAPATSIPDNVQFATVYAKYVSPMIFVLSTFTCFALLPFLYSNAISLAFVVDGFLLILEVVARLLLFIGALTLPSSQQDGSGTMAVGGWLLLGARALDLLSSFLSLPGTQTADAEPPDAALGLVCFMIPVVVIELAYVIYMLFVLHAFRERLGTRQ